MKLLPFVLFVIFATFQPARAESPKGSPASGSMADYRFNGNARDEFPSNPPFELTNTEFRSGALYLNGKYERNETGTGDGYHAVVRCPALDYNQFTVALRFKADDFSQNHINLFTGGTSYRWFGMNRSEDGKLVITFNNQDYAHEVQAVPLTPGEWAVVVCGVDLPNRKVVVYFNGQKAATITLPAGFTLAVADSDAKEQDKRWTFTNFADGTTFHGLVDECIIYGKMLSDEEFARIPLKP